MASYDYVLVGGGLQNALIALAVRARQPDARIALVERADRLGGNHTWCVHGSDVPASARSWFEPLVAFRWPGYRVVFPGWERTIDEPYLGVSSARLDAVVTDAIEGHGASRLLLGTDAESVSPNTVTLSTGEEIRGTSVVDARGIGDGAPADACGFQKFMGLEVELSEPHALELPILMDARMDQTEGYRFMYVLPLSDRRVLLEDTYFNGTPALDHDRLRAGILAYAADQGWTVARVHREETGVLPMPWEGRSPRVNGGPLVAGYRGAWFHPATGYSFPVALRLADVVGRTPPDKLCGEASRGLARQIAGPARFARFLNRLLFRWYPPTARRAIYERFYRLPDDTIRRFYGLRTTGADRWRLLVGRPPPGLSPRHRFLGGAE